MLLSVSVRLTSFGLVAVILLLYVHHGKLKQMSIPFTLEQGRAAADTLLGGSRYSSLCPISFCSDLFVVASVIVRLVLQSLVTSVRTPNL